MTNGGRREQPSQGAIEAQRVLDLACERLGHDWRDAAAYLSVRGAAYAAGHRYERCGRVQLKTVSRMTIRRSNDGEA